MYKKYTVGFKEQAVEKALKRLPGTTLKEVSLSLNVIPSTLRNWVEKANKHPSSNTSSFTKEKRPEQWNFEERLNMIITCGSLDDEAMNECCRKQGVYPHHVKQWKQDFANTDMKNPTHKASETKQLRAENKQLKKELNRKNKALAEAAALLLLQKKVNEIWGVQEDDLL